MSYKAGTVVIDIKADTAKLVAGMHSAQATAKHTSANIVKSVLTISAAYAGISGIKSLTNEFMILENAQIGVMKTTGLSGNSFKALDDELKKMSTTMSGFKLNGMYDTAEAAGQLGIQGVKNITDFTRVIGMIGLTTELSTSQSATSFAKLSNSLNEPIENIEKLASVANELSNTTSATVGDLLKFSQRLSGGAKTAGLLTDEIFGLSATLVDLAINFETGGTNVNRVMLDLISDSDKFAEAIGANVTSFASIVQNEPIKALQQFLEHMNSLSKTDAANFLTDLGYSGTEVKDVLLKLSSNTELLTKNLKIAHDEYAVGTSIQKEYEVASQGLEAQTTKSSSSLTILAAAYGEDLKPVITSTHESLTEMATMLTENKDVVLEVAKILVILGGSILAVNTATKAYTVVSSLAATSSVLFGGSLGSVNRAILISTVSTKALSLAIKTIPFVAVASIAYSFYEIISDSNDTMTMAERNMDNYAKSIRNASDATLDFEITKITKKIAETSKLANDEARARGINGPVSGYGETLAYELTELSQQLQILKKQKETINEIKNENIENNSVVENGSEARVKTKNKYSLDTTSDSIKEQLDLNDELYKKYINITGTDYDKWLTKTNKTMLELAESTTLTTEEMMNAFDVMSQDFTRKEKDDSAQDEIDFNESITDSFEDMLDMQIELASSSQDWYDGLTGVAGEISAVSKAMTKLSVSNLRDLKTKAKLEKKYEKDKKKWGKDSAKMASIDERYQKDSAKLKSANTKNELDAYSHLAGAASGFFKENSTGYKALQAIQIGLQLAIHATALAEMAAAQTTIATSAAVVPAKMAEAGANATVAVTSAGGGDPYTAIARVVAMIALMTSAMGMFGGGGGSVGSGTTIVKAEEEIEKDYTSIIESASFGLSSDDFGRQGLDLLDYDNDFDEFMDGLSRATERLENFGSDGTALKGTIDTLSRNLVAMKAQLPGVEASYENRMAVKYSYEELTDNDGAYNWGNNAYNKHRTEANDYFKNVLTALKNNISSVTIELEKTILDAASEFLDFERYTIPELEQYTSNIDFENYENILEGINGLALKAKNQGGFLSDIDRLKLVDFFAQEDLVDVTDMQEALNILEEFRESTKELFFSVHDYERDFLELSGTNGDITALRMAQLEEEKLFLSDILPELARLTKNNFVEIYKNIDPSKTDLIEATQEYGDLLIEQAEIANAFAETLESVADSIQDTIDALLGNIDGLDSEDSFISSYWEKRTQID
ncbi:MAG: phage tail tape measure protein, partial [Sulfurimonas sp.]|nr:phage tail tape measure protein [Sulfurimonas sp.]